MFLDLICDNNYININIKLAKIVGLDTAVYFAELLNISREVIRKKKFDEATGFFKLDRKYMEDRTTLASAEQLECEKTLKALNIISCHPDDKNKLKVDLEAFANLIIEDNLEQFNLPKKKEKISATQKAANKRAGMIEGMQELTAKIATEKQHEELIPSLVNWVESVYANKRFLTKAIIEVFIDKICAATSDTTEQIALITEAMVSGYPNADWVISKRKSLKSNVVLNTPQETATIDSIDFSQKF